MANAEMTNIVVEPFERVMPKVTDANRHVWQGGASGRLLLTRCSSCGYYLHPPQPVCPRCWSTSLTPEPVSGRGHVFTFTINHYRWVPTFDPPYVVASVELVEQPGLRLLSNVMDCPFDEIRCGLEVEVFFSKQGDVYVPLFRPAGKA